ncbi:DUF6355 family natural product biosynthesis protein [Streptosporangium sp. NPDC000239]|uniref:DUF6355 family natural product biosynthesis protein n=1 Tax=Streptosporangium sp. NPDC000239 TaxID=3154248 RepID=UPI00332FFDDD
MACYHHCGSSGRVLIRVGRTFDRPGHDQCVRPGMTLPGMPYDIEYAWAKGPR